MGAVEGLYIFDEHNNLLLEHVYTGRPPSASSLLPLYLSQPTPRPSLIHLPSTVPPTLLFSLIQDRLLFFAPASTGIEPLLVLEFLARVTDALEEFLGAPLLASKIENNYDVVAQIIGEVCDGGIVCNTEPNALREVVEVPSFVGNLFGGLGLPAASPSLSGRQTPTLQGGNLAFANSLSNTPTTTAGSAIPWRRANVRHTSNELYVDIVETLSVIVAPSGRPLSAVANGTIAFTSKISGVPDLLLRLTAAGGKAGIQHAMDLPSFHPCVRLARWRERPGELSFVPPDGRFVLAGYECDLLPGLFDGDSDSKIAEPRLNLPAAIEMQTNMGSNGDELDVRLTLPLRAVGGSNANAATSGTGSAAARALNNVGRPGINASNSDASSRGPPVEDIVVSIPITGLVRNVTDIKTTRGEASFQPADAILEWRVSSKEAAAMSSGGAALRCTLVGPLDDADANNAGVQGLKVQTDTFDYDETSDGAYQSSNGKPDSRTKQPRVTDSSIKERNRALMPQSASLSFSTKGWLASGIRVDSLTINTQTSKGLGAGVTPYKGVRYFTISRNGIEVRC